MKRSILSLILILAFLTGCQNVGKTLSTTAVSVDAAMQGWAQYVVTGNATAEQEAQVKGAYSKYQVSMKVARDAYVTASTVGDKSIYEQAALVLRNNKAALLSLISVFQQTPLKK